jgi:hypothetical protein
LQLSNIKILKDSLVKVIKIAIFILVLQMICVLD